MKTITKAELVVALSGPCSESDGCECAQCLESAEAYDQYRKEQGEALAQAYAEQLAAEARADQ